MTTTRRTRLAHTLGIALLVAGCGGPAEVGTVPSGSEPGSTVPSTAAAAPETDPAAAGGPGSGAVRDAAGALDAAIAACAVIDTMPLGGNALEPLREQHRALTVGAAHLRAAADTDDAYRDAADAIAAMATNTAVAVALVEEHGEDPDTWDDAAQQAWGAYVVSQVDHVATAFDLCNTVDPPDGSAPRAPGAPQESDGQ